MMNEAAGWLDDDITSSCLVCSSSFHVFKRKHHCRACGIVCCDDCSPFREVVVGYGAELVRVCIKCRGQGHTQQIQQREEEKTQLEERRRNERAKQCIQKEALLSQSTIAAEALLPNINDIQRTMRGPTLYSNWLIPERILVGAWPGHVYDRRCKPFVTSLLASNVRTFVSLVQERDQQEYVEQIDPSMRSQLKFFHFPIQDQRPAGSPSALAAFLDNCLRRQRGVMYLHCFGGHGRAGLASAFILKRLYPYLKMPDILKRVQLAHDSRINPTGFGSSGRSPNTPAQVIQCYRFFHEPVPPIVTHWQSSYERSLLLTTTTTPTTSTITTMSEAAATRFEADGEEEQEAENTEIRELTVSDIEQTQATLEPRFSMKLPIEELRLEMGTGQHIVLHLNFGHSVAYLYAFVHKLTALVRSQVPPFTLSRKNPYLALRRNDDTHIGRAGLIGARLVQHFPSL